MTKLERDLSYLDESLRKQVIKLPAEMKEKFVAQTQLTVDLIESVASDISEELLDGLITAMEKELEAEEKQNNASLPQAKIEEKLVEKSSKEDKPKQKRKKPASKTEEKPAEEKTQKGGNTPVEPASRLLKSPEIDVDLSPGPIPTANVDKKTEKTLITRWDMLFPLDVPMVITNRGGGMVEISVLSEADRIQEEKIRARREIPSRTKQKAPSSKKAINPQSLLTKEYVDWSKNFKKDYPTLEARIEYATERGLVRGVDWQYEKENGEAYGEKAESMSLGRAIRKKLLNIKKYIPGAETAKERKLILSGQKAFPNIVEE